MTNDLNQSTRIRQRFLGSKGLIAYIALMNMFIPLSTDMYLPALPSMSQYFGSSSAIVNLTLSAFFIFYAVGIIFWGPISDKNGRKPVLLIGGIIYLASSISCALSFNIYFLILSRICQGIGAGGITSVSIAVIKDTFAGKKRETIIAVSQSVSGLAPMIAPVIGGLIMRVSDWRGSFWVLTAISVINLLLTFLFQETIRNEDRYQGSLIGAIGRLAVVARNKSFIIPAVIFALSAIPFMGYIAISAYIYVDFFKLSTQTYSYFFAANAMISIFGPFLYVKFLSRVDRKAFAAGIFVLSMVSGFLVLSIGTRAPVIFWLSFALMSLSGSIMRPYSTNVLLEQQKSDTGAVSSLLSTLFTVLGSIGMSLASLPWRNIVFSLGAIIAIFSTVSLVGWVMFMKSSIPCASVKDAAAAPAE